MWYLISAGSHLQRSGQYRTIGTSYSLKCSLCPAWRCVLYLVYTYRNMPVIGQKMAAPLDKLWAYKGKLCLSSVTLLSHTSQQGFLWWFFLFNCSPRVRCWSLNQLVHSVFVFLMNNFSCWNVVQMKGCSSSCSSTETWWTAQAARLCFWEE